MPQPSWVEPALATLTGERFSRPGWIFERKFDGERCLTFRDGDRVRLMTRNQKQVARTYPEIAVAIADLEATDFIVDGEVVAFEGDETSFSRLQQRIGLTDPDRALRTGVAVFYYLFDVMYADGRDTTGLPLLERKRILSGLLSFSGDADGPLRFTEHIDTDGEEYWRQACRRGWEGVIAKRADAPYRHGRTRDWLKFKCENSQEFVIGGYTDPERSRVGFGALLLGYHDGDGHLVYAGKVGTGFSNALLRDLHREMARMERDQPPFTRGPAGGSRPGRALPRSGAHWIEPRLVCQVAFSEWTTDGQLRHPRFRGLRRDKEPADVVRETPSAAASPSPASAS
jgi:DNA ligase D-like protein (predicted ligase)